MTASSEQRDVRFDEPIWVATESSKAMRRVRWFSIVNVVTAAWYFAWLLRPERVGNRVLFTLLVSAEVFNVVQAAGFWWTCASRGGRKNRKFISNHENSAPIDGQARVDIFIPTYSEPVSIVEPTVAAAMRVRGGKVTVWLLDDGNRAEMQQLAQHCGARYIARQDHTGAKAGNINNALTQTTAPYVVILDCDHVPSRRFLEATLPSLSAPKVAFVQTPQYYANSATGLLAAAAWSQQAIFFGPIGRGKARQGAMFCCGTTVVFRREALAEIGGFPEDSLTEDFELSLRLHERGWKSTYVAEVLASGLGPEDMASYVIQQHRWARGCMSSLPRILRAKVSWRVRTSYFLASIYFLSGFTVLAYMSLPVARIISGAQPLSAATADQFLLHFLPYFVASLATVSIASEGSFTFGAFALATASFWIHIHALYRAVLRRPSRFVVTPKQGATRRQPTTVLVPLATSALLIASAIYGLSKGVNPSILNNVAFVLLHVAVLSTGMWPALVGKKSNVEAAAPSDVVGVDYGELSAAMRNEPAA